MTMKTSFISSLAIFSFIDARYLDSLASVFVFVNILNIIPYSKSSLGFLQPSLFNSKSTKSINKIAYIRSDNIRSTCIRNIYAKSIYTRDIFSP